LVAKFEQQHEHFSDKMDKEQLLVEFGTACNCPA